MKKCTDCKVNEVRNNSSSLCDKCFDKALEQKVVEQPQASWF